MCLLGKGITLIALVITVIILIILAAITINLTVGESGIITRTEEANFKMTISEIAEEFELYIANKTIEDDKFEVGTLNAGKNNLTYSTQPKGEIGNISTILPNADKEQIENFEIIKGELIYNSQDKRKLEWVRELGIKINPYKIVNGVLLSSNTNLVLMDEKTGTLVIPENVTEIGYGAFSNLSALKTIVIPGSVKRIGAQAFSGNQTLENVIIEEGVEIIGNSAFRGCEKLKKVRLPQSLKTIEEIAFDGCRTLEEINIPESITRIEQWTFASCALTQIILPENLEYIGNYSFAGTLLTSIKIPSKVTEIRDNIFSNCQKLDNIDLTGNNNYVYVNGMLMTTKKDKILFLSDTYLKSITTFSIPEGVTEFNMPLYRYPNINTIKIPTTLELAFENNNNPAFPPNIAQIEIADGNENFEVIGQCLVRKKSKKMLCCFSKEEVITIPEGIKIIGGRALYSASKVQTINTPNSLVEIEIDAFGSPSTLKNVNISKSVERISGGAFRNRGDINVTISNDNPYYRIEDGIIYNKDKTILVSVVKETTGTFYIPEGVKVLENNSMLNNKASSIIIPEGCTQIKSGSFTNCFSLTKVIVPSSIEIIETCFGSCSNLNEVVINKEKGSIQGAPWGAPKGDKVVYWKE